MPSVTVTTPEAGVARIAIDRPSKRNAIDPETRDALIAAIAAALGDDKVHALLLGSEAGHFCAGGDIDSMAGLDIAAAVTLSPSGAKQSWRTESPGWGGLFIAMAQSS